MVDLTTGVPFSACYSPSPHGRISRGGPMTAQVADPRPGESGGLPDFQAPYAPADEPIAAHLLAGAPRSHPAEARIDGRTTRLVQAIRSKTAGLGGIEDFLHAYSLSTKEGLAPMVLAEALLRVPDATTADRLIEDKLAAGDWTVDAARAGVL